MPGVEYNQTPAIADNNATQIEFCKKYAMVHIAQGLCSQFNSQIDATAITKALRTCLALMDRSEIGSVIVPHIFAPAVLSVYHFYMSDSPRSLRNDVLRSGSMFFDSVESPTIWAQIIGLIQSSFQESDKNSWTTTCGAIIFVATKFNLQDEDMQKVHIPLAAAYLVLQIHQKITGIKSVEKLRTLDFSRFFKAAASLLQQLPNDGLGSETHTTTDSQAITENFDEVLSTIEVLYTNSWSVVTATGLSLVIGKIALKAICQILSVVISFDNHLSYETTDSAVILFDTIMRKAPSVNPDFSGIISQLTKFEYHSITSSSRHQPMSAALSRVSILEVMALYEQSEEIFNTGSLRRVIRQLVGTLWDALMPTRPEHHVEASKAMWRLHNVCGTNDLVESCIVDISIKAFSSTHEDPSMGLRHCQIFAVFWQQSQSQAELFRNRRTQIGKIHNTLSLGKSQLLARPLFAILDKLLGNEDEIHIFVCHWLHQVPELPMIMNVVLAHVVHATTALISPDQILSSPKHIDIAAEDEIDVARSVYFIRLLAEVLTLGHANVQHVIKRSDTDDLRQQVLTRLEMVADLCLKLQSNHRYSVQIGRHSAMTLRQSSLKLLRSTISLFPLKAYSV